MTFAGNYQGPLYAPHPDIKKMKLTKSQLEQFKANYACLIVDGMDMKTLEQFAMEMVEQNMTHWNEQDVKEEILDYYGEETLMDLMPESVQEPTEIGKLEATADDYGVGK